MILLNYTKNPVGKQCLKQQMEQCYNNKMSEEYNRLGQKENNSSKRFDQHIPSNGFGLFSSQERLGENHHDESFQQLSNVEEKSYFSSEPELPDHLYIQNFLGKIREVQGRQITQSPQPNTRSRRIEDQEIIVVQEENEVNSNVDNNESLILEHIEFANDPHPENTPEWDHEFYNKLDTSRKRVEELREKGWKEEKDLKAGREKEGDMKYVINLLPDNHEHQLWGDNYSSSTPRDFESQGFKLFPSRNSKNTCIDRSEPLDTHLESAPIRNKSCIEPPLKFDQDPKNAKPKKYPSVPSKGKDIQHILDKWHEQLYPRLEDQYNVPSRRSSAQVQLQRDGKYNLSLGESPSTPVYRSQAVVHEMVEIGMQSELTGEELLLNQKYLSEQIAQVRSRNQKLQEEVRFFKESLKNKQYEIQSIKKEQPYFGDQSKLLISRNRQLQRIVTLQNETIRQFQERQETLQKKLHKTVSYHTLASSPDERSPTFYGGQSQPLKLTKLQTFGLEGDFSHSHERCRKQAEELQERIFDLQQKIAGIDIQVERRVRILSEAVQQEIEEKTVKEIQNHREESNRLKENIKTLQDKMRETEEEIIARERELSQREAEVNRMHQELLSEWKEIERKEIEKKQNQRHRTEIRVSSNTLSPISAIKSRFDLEKLPTLQSDRESRPSPSRYYCPSSKQLKPPIFSRDRLNYPTKRVNDTSINHSVSYFLPLPEEVLRKATHRLNQTEKFNSSFTRLADQNGWGREERKWAGEQNRRGGRWAKESVKIDVKDSGQLSVINSKIQRLRKEINRELCSFHS